MAMSFILITSLGTAAMFGGMLLFAEVGRRAGIRQMARHGGTLTEGAGAAEAAVFALLGLLLAFTFSGAASRFENRRHLINTEANAIGTAYLRLDLLAADAQPELRQLFRTYVENRASVYSDANDEAATRAKLAAGAALQQQIWTKSVNASQQSGAAPQAGILLLPALNDMIDITTTRVSASQNHPPMVVFLLLAVLGFLGALLVGYATSTNKKRGWLHTLVFAAILSLTAYVIVDLEYPRLGFIRVDVADQLLRELRESMR
jgi:hypothetical protein